MCRKGKFNFVSKVLTAIMMATILISLPITLLAQSGDLPCSDQDPTQSPCPLDTWVWWLVIAAAIFGAIRLNRKQRSQLRG
jgi:hypothetical protein